VLRWPHREVQTTAHLVANRNSLILNGASGELLGSSRENTKYLCNLLAPQFAFKPGRDAIQKHYQGIIDAGASNITLELKNLELRGIDGVWTAGNYSIIGSDLSRRREPP
jgi:hypothetical protein